MRRRGKKLGDEEQIPTKGGYQKKGAENNNTGQGGRGEHASPSIRDSDKVGRGKKNTKKGGH